MITIGIYLAKSLSSLQRKIRELSQSPECKNMTAGNCIKMYLWKRGVLSNPPVITLRTDSELPKRYIGISFTEEEFEEIKEKALNQGFNNVKTFILSTLLAQNVELKKKKKYVYIKLDKRIAEKLKEIQASKQCAYSSCVKLILYQKGVLKEKPLIWKMQLEKVDYNIVRVPFTFDEIEQILEYANKSKGITIRKKTSRRISKLVAKIIKQVLSDAW